MWLHELADADASCGGKAVGLARLIAAGLPVPPGFVLDDGLFEHVARLDHGLAAAAERIDTAELPPELEREVVARAAALGPHVVVRSSATIEDGATGAGAGVFASEHAVPSAQVWAAIRAVWSSALAPLAVAYARRRAADVRIGVIVQAFAPGELVTIYTRPPGEPDGGELVVQRGGAIARESRATPSALGALALRAEAAIGAAATGADVELAGAALVQARPIVHPVRRARPAPPPIVLAPLRDGRVWTWDVAHNPDPLSPAQIGLVDAVEHARLGRYALRVVAGYLYTTPRDDHAPAAIDAFPARAAAITSKLDAALSAGGTSFDDALAHYLAAYAIWANELSPLVAAARAAFGRSAHRPSSVEATLGAAAAGALDFDAVVAALGDLAPAWDVAVPTFAERPELLRAAIARATAIDPQPDDHSPEIDRGGGEAEAALAADLAERDDLYFARMQALVRHALLARARELELDGDDIFWLDPADARSSIERDTAHRRAAAARAAHERAAAWDMPLAIGAAGLDNQPPRATLSGVGSGPRVTGRAVRFASLAGAALVGSGDVVVVRAVTPALAVFVGRCAAIVSETGGLLDHGAALARELGIPCVVGCAGAWGALDDGTIVTVDGDAGTVSHASSS